MARARASIEARGRLQEAEALWYDRRRWPSFVDDFGHLARDAPDWPREGELLWDSRPGGRGRVRERVLRYTAGDGQDVEVEDERLTATQAVRFAPAGEDRVRVSLELTWQLKNRYPGSALVDQLFIRARMRDALQRTLNRFAVELRTDREL